ncbi:hypothetical protein [Croceibacter atlanticus]|uniref:hypothetical protein n=1 Tax=Croceibacter atlanticus TaxID=313588 RepID=UPI0030DBF6E0|tara:strand:- start:93604 stop:95004 length:1401 start_codon:yes stop_codon:yes gene_type:complete
MRINNVLSKIITFINILLLLLIVYNLFYFIKYPYLATDSGFYLSVARDIYQGSQYFTEIASSYNPLAIIIIGLPYFFSDDPNTRLFLLVNFIVMIFSAKIFYNILKENFRNPKQINFLFTALFFLGYLIFEGKYVLLEPISVLFQLFAFYYYLRSKASQNLFCYLIVGFFISLSFFSKQFGLFIIIPILIDILITNKKWFKKCYVITIGFSIPIALLYMYYAYYGVSLEEYIMYILGKGIEFDKGIGTGSTIGIIDLLLSFTYFTLFNFYILLIPIAFFILREIRRKESFIFIFSALVSLSVLYFASYFHYYLYILPYFILLTAYVSQFLKKQSHSIAFTVSLLLSCSLLSVYSYLTNNKAKDNYNNQNESLIRLQNIIPEKSLVYIVDPSKAYYFLGKYNSINPSKIGYCFPNYFYTKTICDNLNKGNFIIVGPDRLNEYVKELKIYNLSEIIIENRKYTIIEVL